MQQHAESILVKAAKEDINLEEDEAKDGCLQSNSRCGHFVETRLSRTDKVSAVFFQPRTNGSSCYPDCLADGQLPLARVRNLVVGNGKRARRSAGGEEVS